MRRGQRSLESSKSFVRNIPERRTAVPEVAIAALKEVLGNEGPIGGVVGYDLRKAHLLHARCDVDGRQSGAANGARQIQAIADLGDDAIDAGRAREMVLPNVAEALSHGAPAALGQHVIQKAT